MGSSVSRCGTYPNTGGRPVGVENRIVPSNGGMIPSSVLISVDLPEPLDPSRPVKLPRWMFIEIPERTGCPSYPIDSSCSVIKSSLIYRFAARVGCMHKDCIGFAAHLFKAQLAGVGRVEGGSCVNEAQLSSL